MTIALQAPSGSNRQAWQWLVIDDPAQRAAVGAVYKRACDAYRRRRGRPGGCSPTTLGAARYSGGCTDSVAHLAEHMGDVPVLVIPCLRVNSGRLPEGNQADLWGSILPAAWSFMLAARSRGLGTAWTTLHLEYEEEVADILSLPPGVFQAALIPVAYHLGDGFRPAPREPLADVLHYDRW